MAVVACLFSCSDGEDADDVAAKLLKVGVEAPDFTLVTDDAYNGKTLSSFRGKRVVIEFWRSSCPDCRSVTNSVKSLYTQYASDDLVFLGVSFDKDVDDWKSYVEKNGMAWIQYHDQYLDTSNSLKLSYGITWVPTFYVIDKEGRVEYATIEVSELSAKLAELTE